MSDKLRKAFDRAWKASEARSWQRGLLGKPNGDGTFTVAVADRPGHYYVRVSSSGGLTVTTARTNGRVAARAGLPVKMRLERGGGLTIIEVDTTAALDAATANDAVSVYGVPQHTHALDSNMAYLIEAQRVEPGLVHPAGGWSVTVEPFRYLDSGSWVTYEGETLDLSTNQPSTTGKHRLVLITLDPATNTAAATSGSDADYATALTQADIDDFTVTTAIPLGAVIMRADDADINSHAKYIDARGWLNLSGSLADGSVTSAKLADGAVTTAKLTDAAVTNAKLANMAEATIKGRADSSGTGAPVDLTASQAATIVAGGAADGVWANAKLADMAEGTIKGRALAAGTGAPQDLTAGQAAAIVGTGALNVDTTATGNVGTGEDIIATYTIPAGTLASDGDSIWFEAWGTSNDDESDTYTFKIYFGATLIHSVAATNWGSAWLAWGRIVRTGATSQKAFSQMLTNSGYGAGSFGGGLYIAAPAETLSGSVVLAITAEAVSNDDVVCTSFVVGKTPA